MQVKYLSGFHQQLSYCIMQYVEKDPQLSAVTESARAHRYCSRKQVQKTC